MRLTRAPLTSSPAEAAFKSPANAFSTTPLLTCRAYIGIGMHQLCNHTQQRYNGAMALLKEICNVSALS